MLAGSGISLALPLLLATSHDGAHRACQRSCCRQRWQLVRALSLMMCLWSGRHAGCR